MSEYGTFLAEANAAVADASSAINQLGVVEAAALTAMFSQEKLPFYASSKTNPDAGNPLLGIINENEFNKGFSCAARAGLIHAVLTENMRLYPVIASTYIAEWDSTHYFNVALDTDTGEIVIVDNGRAKNKKRQDVGTHDLIVDPRYPLSANPAIFSALFEIAMTGAADLYEDPLINSSVVAVPFLEVPTYNDEYTTDIKFHVRPENAPTVKDIERNSIKRLADTKVTVLSNDASNRLVDKLVGAKNLQVA